ncbi:carboxy terminal-processing peptidase [Parachryseolinea silvisoli]|uniref:carboxy terminal-processing peptidase n=1 Tax=Parachryseolinea silvisoli TaxID=2873601 RepID=UPI002265D3D1|nr:carboxy terminal-processing peptidase [Parachryseolinea silvisoli]MCD9019085.1 carboxy terminal-processing peptidase [Parachryseolinea silvisoli]
MYRISFRRLLPLSLGLAAICTGARAQGHVPATMNFKTEAFLLKNKIVAEHYSPPAIDDAFSAAAFDLFMDNLDPERLIFTDGEVQALKTYRDKLDDEINGKSWSFLPAATKGYQKALARATQAINQGTQRAFDFSAKETYNEDTLWTKDEAFIFERWRLLLKYETLVRLTNTRSRNTVEPEAIFLKNQEPATRNLVKTINLARLNRVINNAAGFENYVGIALLRAVANTIDAHTNYFSPKEMEDFMSELSTEGYLFGFQLKTNDMGDLVIDQLTPGGPAWKSGAIHTGDVLDRLRWEGGNWIELAGLDPHEAGLILDESNHQTLEIEFHGPGGQQTKVLLKKEKMSDDDNIVKSFVLQRDERKIGYIYLPGFYTDWNGTEGSKSANDVAAAILKLKKENIEGIILDVRFNGGGSLQEAVAMAGIFIDAGPIGLLKNKGGDIVTVKDMNRGTIYNGPLVLMVNALSASASEFLAAALKDYHRAIIVGSRTYGKATSQLIYPLDPKNASAKFTGVTKSPLGYTAITVEKIYRINGKTIQRKGVVPDIQLPDLLNALPIREQDVEHTLPSDSVQKKTYYDPLPFLPLKMVRAKSDERVAASGAFKQQQYYATALRQQDGGGESLLFKDMLAASQQEQTLGTGANVTRGTTAYRVNLLPGDVVADPADDYKKNINTAWITRLLQDIYIEESFYILNDQLNQSKKP